MFFKRPNKPAKAPVEVSPARRAFFRNLFLKAVEGVEHASHDLAQRMKPLTGEEPRPYPAAHSAPWSAPLLETYGPPWPPPYGPPVPLAILTRLRLNPPPPTPSPD
jgi:hypothetical protein